MKPESPVIAPSRLVVGISGSSAPHYGIRILQAFRGVNSIETHLVVSPGAERTIQLETDMSLEHVKDLADHWHDPMDFAAPISSGSFLTLGMVVAPCSMKTLAAIAIGYSDNLLSRAADVTLKERRRLVLVPRETPLSVIHLRNMLQVTEAGAIILPPVPAFYHKPRPSKTSSIIPSARHWMPWGCPTPCSSGGAGAREHSGSGTGILLRTLHRGFLVGRRELLRRDDDAAFA